MRTCVDLETIRVPTPSKAFNGQQGDLWKAAIDDGFQSYIVYGTWKLDEFTAQVAVQHERGHHRERHPSQDRLVTQGFSQKFGVDFDKVFAPFAKQATFRSILSIASRHGMLMKHVDVKNAHLMKNWEDILRETPTQFACCREA